MECPRRYAPSPVPFASHDGAFDAEPDVSAQTRDDAPVARPVPARHRRLARQLGAGDDAREGVEHRLGTAREHVARVVRKRLGDERRVEHDLGVRDERRRLGMVCRPEAEQRGRPAECLGEIREGSDADAAADEERPPHREVEAVAERPGHPDRVRAGERGDRACPAPDRIDEERELARPGRDKG